MSVKTRCAGALAAGLAVCLAFAPAPALAVPGSPQWTVTSVSAPTNFAPGQETGAYTVTVTNTGGASSDGSPIAISDELPAGLSLDSAGASGEDQLAEVHNKSSSANFSCVFRTCTYTGTVVPDDTLAVTFPVDVAASPSPSCEVPAGATSCVTNVVRVSGGGAPDASMSTPTAISSLPAGFGIAPGGAATALSTTQAGAHPDLTVSIAFNTVLRRGALAGDPKDTTYELPPGFAGDLVDTPSCSLGLFALKQCPIATQVGVTTLSLDLFGYAGKKFLLTEPVYNLSPSPGVTAKLGFSVVGVFSVQGDVSVRPGDYGLSTTFHDVNESPAELDNVSLTLWGVPADPIHDPLRWNPSVSLGEFGVSSQATRVPFFTNPTSCGAQPLTAAFKVDSWQQPGESVGAQMPFGPLVGCDRLGMEPSLTAEATTRRAYSPTGFDLGMTIPQTYENPDGLATSTLKRAVVTLPEGMTVNPSAGAGLGACTEAQLAQEAAQFVSGEGCPNESKLGEVRIVTPAIKEPIAGSVFLAQPYVNPFKSLLALYIVARLPDRGIIVKAAGEVTADPLTGRLVTTFDNLPPLPFSTALIPPFPITGAFDGGVCPSGGVPSFNPQVLAGTQNNDAGSYSPLDIHITRNDGEQEITGLSFKLPPGLTANLSGVPFCSEADIALARTKTGAQEEAEPSCPAQSQIGHLLGGAGVGPVLAEAPGKIYMAGPYEGAPFSVVSIISAKVGPFDLGTVVVHLPLQINPLTAAVSVGAGGSDQIPHIVKGIVIHVRDIRVYIDKQNFTLNPTSCERQTFAATVIGSGQSFTNPADDIPVTVTNPFQGADCQNLKFKPIFKVSTSGKTSRANGASLSVKLTYPSGPVGTQANIAKVKVDLPKQLPSRLTTLQRACTAAQFNANPAGCPAASIVGHAKAITPILPVPLEGPAYFVSHGGEAFPSLIVVLQGYGVTIDLVGSTFISKAGITSSTFKTVPDQPVTSFELTLPQGKFSALAANGDLCKSKLAMPTAFTGQNGAVIHQSTKVGVTGCPKVKKKAAKHRKMSKRAEGKKK